MNQANSGNSAFYGGIDSVTNDSFSFGTWASNVGFSDDTSYEWDIYAAYFGKLPFFQSYNYEIGYTYYSYPDAINPYGLNFSEAYIGLSTDSFAVRYNYLMSGPDNAAAGLDTYLNFSYTKSLHNDFSFIASVGFYSGSVVISGDQTDYMVGLSKNNFTFSTVGTNKPEYSPKVVIQYELNIL